MTRSTNEPPAVPTDTGWRVVLRAHWEVFAAVLVLVGVLAIIDVASIGEVTLVSSLMPLACVTAAALSAWSLGGVAAWVAGIVAVATFTGDMRYLGLAYPAAGLGILLLLQTHLGRR